MSPDTDEELEMRHAIAAVALAAAALMAAPARAHNELSALSALSALPLASVVGTASAAAGAVVIVPAALSTAGAVLVVKSVEASARSTVYLLERASDGARVSVEAAHHSALAVGTAVTVSVIGAGVVLSAAGEAIAFIPNALGQALLHNERLTH
jgi:hypothetical protein